MVSKKQMARFKEELANGTVKRLVEQGYSNGQLMQRYNLGRSTLVKHCGPILNRNYHKGSSRRELLEIGLLEESSPARLFALTKPWKLSHAID